MTKFLKYVLFIFLLKCVENNADETYKAKLSDDLIKKVDLAYQDRPLCICMPPERCRYHKPENNGSIDTYIFHRFGGQVCKKESDYCCPVICNHEHTINEHALTTKMPFINAKGDVPIEEKQEKIPQKCGTRTPGGSAGYKPHGGARHTGIGEFPWMAVIFAVEDGEAYFQCGGSLIHPHAVLTAAQCVINPESDYLVRVGEYNPAGEDETWTHHESKVSKVVYHEEFYSGTLVNDIAVLILDCAVPLKTHIQPICLPTHDDILEVHNCYVTGWGTNLKGTTGIFTNLLESVKLDIVKHEECEANLRKSLLGPKFNLKKTFICAGGEGSDSCKGDGGGPLVCKIPGERRRYKQVGIVSWGVSCGKYPGIYTNVALYADWIQHKLHEHHLNYNDTFFFDDEDQAIFKV